MRFGVYIRSVGERTEKLCLESCCQCVDPKDVHLLKNYYPSYNVYKEMFARAAKSDYEWFLGLDADVILTSNWFDKVTEKIETVNSKNTFKFTFNVYDPVYNELADRGNHIYNNAFTLFAINALKKNIFISRLPRIFKKYYVRGHYLKPETSIRGMLKKKYNLSNFNFPDVIGFHSAEQYFSEIFRSFLVRSRRNPDWIKEYNFLQKEKQKELLEAKEYDRYVANLGWNFNEFSLDTIDARQLKSFQKILTEYKIKERDPLAMSLESFYKKYLPKEKFCSEVKRTG